MATMVLNATDLFDFEVIESLNKPSPFPLAGASIKSADALYHPKAGSIQLKHAGFPHLQLIDMRWDIASDIELHDTVPSNSISINFMLEGTIDSRFRGLSHDLNMRAGTHNLIHTPESGHTNQMKGGQSMASLLIGLDRDFFAAAIGSDDAWSEQILTELHHDRPFSGVRGVQTITPQMRHLIDDIRSNKATGPMRNLLIQSRVLELVALEIDQFRKPVAGSETVPPHEAEKLHQLKAYLEATFLEEHTLAQLSRYCLLNEFKVKKGFKELFDTTVFNYLRKLRMEYAGKLLRHCSYTVDEVAAMLGYEHSQHFSIAYKKYTGLTPTHYQQGKKSVVMA
ncbi:helix-turn-helix transcriptional regulator [Larkinella rosea]|uniref:AraC family transcriptional regulator n=1 Tax=Larkinella rosea TaxID=2025312 RepID=A0A3P1BN58_9BACT|nr:AraC family transcriptional regulator [Larkinella rosea]RRB02478.1 AraC family transcriptional regulator [Larkinella rosea]